MAMTDKEREERREARAKALRAEKMRTVFATLSKTKGKTTRQIAKETGYSEDTVGSALRWLRKQTDDWAGEPLAHDFQTHEWRLAKSWPDNAGLSRWLMRHLITRAESIKAEMDVSYATYPGDVPPLLIAALMQMESVMQMLDQVVINNVPNGRPHHDRGVNLHG